MASLRNLAEEEGFMMALLFDLIFEIFGLSQTWDASIHFRFIMDLV
jgi:hypothetical protein